MQLTSKRSDAWPAVVLLELLLAVGIIVVGGWSDRQERSTGAESPVAAYASAVARGDEVAALEQVAPAGRETAVSFVSWQLGNRYTILESAVRRDSVLDSLAGERGDHVTVALVLEIQEEGGARWQAVEDAPVVRIAGRWYLAKPLLQPGQGG